MKSRGNIIKAPTNCPSCDSELELEKDQLFCRNPNCLGSVQKRIEHFTKTMKIKGLGPASIGKLNLNDLIDIYDISQEYISARLNSEKMGEKLYAEIQNSKRHKLNTVLPSLGIPLIGKSATEKLSRVFDGLFDIDYEGSIQAGVGPKASTNLVEWIENNEELICELPFDLEFEKSTTSPVKNNGVVCISGKLISFSTKAEATDELEKRGYVVKSNITNDTNILVNESGRETAKTKKARDKGIKIVENLSQFIGE